MTVTTQEQSALEQLAAARLRGAQPDELLDLADAAIEQATVGNDAATLELIAAELDAAAAAEPERRDGLRVAAARARAASSSPSLPATTLPEAPPEPRTAVELASWSSRFAAWLIDWMILFGAATAIAVAISYPLGDTTGDGAAYVAFFLLIPIAFLYFTLLNGRGKTVGKRLQGISVVDKETLGPIGGGRGALRELVRLVLAPYFVFLIDGLWPLWDKRNQTLHDKAARSIVVRDPHEPTLLTPPPQA